MPVYDEIWAGPGRNVKRANGQPVLTTKWYVTIHNTSNDATAAGEAAYARVRTDGVGAHYFIDDREVLQSTDTDWCVGHVGSNEGNSRGISYEITGVNGWTREQWLSNVAWGKLAAVIARDCLQYGIPVRLLTIEEMRAFNAGLKGFITHDMARRAWGGTTHTDPGSNFPMDHLLTLVARALNGDNDMADIDPDHWDDLIWRVDALFANAPEVRGGRWVGKPEGVNQLHNALAAIQGDLKALELGGVDPAALAAELAPLLPAPATPDQIADAVADEQHERLKD